MRQAGAALWAAVAATMLAAALVGWAPFAPPGAEPGAQRPQAPAPMVPPPPIANATTLGPGPVPMAFGIDAGSLAQAAALGARPDYGTLWIGLWTLQDGWLVPDAQLRAMRAANVTPAIHLYYWGDDMAPACLQVGCAGKTQAGWDRLATELAQHLNATLGGAPALVFLETEFNKAGVALYKPLDALLAAKAEQMRTVPGVRTVLALGNWNAPAWTTWTAAANASDFTGLQAMFGATRDPLDAQARLLNATLSGARQLKADFGKPVILQDLAFSSWPSEAARQAQASTMERFMECLGPLKEAGVQAMLYRALEDDPQMDLANHYGIAERHFGLADGDGLKPAGEAWVQGIERERGHPVPAGGSPSC